MSQTVASPAFDQLGLDYDQALQQGLSLYGEDKSFFARRRLTWLAGRLRRLGVRAETVLDYGCGTGGATPLFFEVLGAKAVLGLDLSPQSLAVAARTYAAASARFSTCGEYVPDGSADLVFCNGVYHHVPPAERPAVTRFITDCLRPGGLFALWENNPWNPGTRLMMSRIPFDRDAVLLRAGEARSLVRGAGLKVLATDYCFFFPRVLRALRGIEPSLSRFPLGGQYLVLSQKAG